MSTAQDPPRWLEPESGADPRLRRALETARAELPSPAQLAALSAKVASDGLVIGTGAKTEPLFAKIGFGKLTAGMAVVSAAAGLYIAASDPATPPAVHRGTVEPHTRSATEPESPASPNSPSWEPPTAHRRTPSEGSEALIATPARRADPVRVSVPIRDVEGPDSETPSMRIRLPPATRGRGRGSLPSVEARRRQQSTGPDDASGGRNAAATPFDEAGEARATPAGANRKPGDQHGATNNSSEPSSAIEQAAEEPNRGPVANARRPTELRLIAQVQGRLAHDPEAALALTDELARRYPLGAFVEEREALAIDALRRLGRDQAAVARARAFVARFPDSPYGAQMRRWLR